MILFKSYHIPKIWEGKKTQTRRPLGRNFKVGSVHQIKVGFKKDDYRGNVRILAVRHEFLKDITPEDAKREGYASIEAYMEAFHKIYGNNFNELSRMQVIDFEYIGYDRVR